MTGSVDGTPERRDDTSADSGTTGAAESRSSTSAESHSRTAAGSSDTPAAEAGTDEPDCVVCEWIRRAVDRPTLGRNTRRTVIAWAALVAFLVAVATGLAVESLLRADVRHWVLAEGHTALRTTTIFAALCFLPAALAYALWNGGPGTAATLGLAPIVASSLPRLQVTLAQDEVGSLVVASLAATLALVVDERWSDGERWDRGHLENGLLIASTVTVVAGVAAWRYAAADTSPLAPAVDLAGLLLVPAVLVLAWYWGRWWLA